MVLQRSYLKSVKRSFVFLFFLLLMCLDPNALPIMRVLHQSHTHLLLQSITGAGLRGEGFIGIYSPEERKARIERFLEKRKHRMWLKKVKYDVRKV